MSRVKKLVRVLDAIIVAIATCWPLLIVPLVIAFVLARIPQGREVLLSAEEQTGRYLWTYLLFCAIGLLAMLASRSLLDEKGLSRGDDARGFAGFFVPGLFCIAYFFSVPCMLELSDPTHRNLLENEGGKASLTGLLLVVGSFFPLMRNIWIVDLITNLPVGSSSKRTRLKQAMAAKAAAPVSASDVRKSWCGVGCYFAWMVTWAIFADFAIAPPLWVIASLTIVVMAFGDALTWPRMSKIDGEVINRLTKSLVFPCSLPILACGAVLLVAPVGSSPFFGSAACIAILCGVAMLGVRALKRLTKRNVTVGAVVSVSLLCLTGTGDFNSVNVRTYPKFGPSRTRSDVRQVIGEWLDERKGEIVASGKYPLVLATAEGGGIRAALWTACCLGALEDETEGRFSRHLFAISAVSGGSLGAATFAALVRQANSNATFPTNGIATNGPSSPTSPNRTSAHSFEDQAAGILSHDFLSAPIATMLAQDLLRTCTRFNGLLDRGAAIEIAFERAWQREMGSDTFSRPFEDLWAGDRSTFIPQLFLNGTEATTGERMVMAAPATAPMSQACSDIQEGLGDRSVRLSTAVMMSARFPGISPVGRYVDANTGVTARVVDGGYSDNSGAATVLDLAALIQGVAKEKGIAENIDLVVLMIPNDPRQRRVSQQSVSSIGPTQAAVDEATSNDSLLGAAFSPVATLDGVRQGLSAKFKEDLRAVAGESLVELELFKSDLEFPLGWMLSETTQKEMRRQIDEMKRDVNSDFQKVVRWLRY